MIEPELKAFVEEAIEEISKWDENISTLTRNFSDAENQRALAIFLSSTTFEVPESDLIYNVVSAYNIVSPGFKNDWYTMSRLAT
jgi:hypothetical protein